MSTLVRQEADGGTYTCVVTSATGESSWSGVLTVRGALSAPHTFPVALRTLHTLSPQLQTASILARPFTTGRKKTTTAKQKHSNCCCCASKRVNSSPVLCHREWRAFPVQSVRVHSAAGAAAETCGDGGDQEHRHTHLAVQPSRRRSRRHLLHHRGLQVNQEITRSLNQVKCSDAKGLNQWEWTASRWGNV